MEKENCASFNSPVIQKNTPIKRLGLSRKRKSCNSPSIFEAKIQACSEGFSEGPSRSEKFLLNKPQLNATKDSEDAGNNQSINYDSEIEFLERKIAEEEAKVKTMQCDKNNILQLENLIELWRTGCKNAFLHFSHLLRDRQSENIDFKAVLSKLGIWETMIENFESDSEISLSDYSQ